VAVVKKSFDWPHRKKVCRKSCRQFVVLIDVDKYNVLLQKMLTLTSEDEFETYFPFEEKI